MAQRQRAYFFNSPFTTAGDKFNPNNIPKSSTFADLLDSVCFKTEAGDLATALQQGLVLLSTTAVSKARAGAGVVLPVQLPVLTYGVANTELITPGVQSYEGIKLTAVDKTNRLDYQVDFDPYSISTKVDIVQDDCIVIMDSEDSNKPKRMLASDLGLTGSGTLWKKSSTVLSPNTANDSLDMSGASVTADSFLLKAAASTYINPLAYTSNNGANLIVSAGAGQHASAPKTGGALYLYGGVGANGGLSGNTFLGWDGTSIYGSVNIRGAAVAGFDVAIHGKTWHDGTITITPIGLPGGITPSTAVILGSDNILYYRTFKNLMTDIIGGTTPAGNSILSYDSGTAAYSHILVGATKNTFLHTNASSGALEMVVLDMTDRVDNAAVVAGANIAWAKMAALTASRVAQIGAGGVMEASAIPIANLAFLDATSSIQTQFNAIGVSVDYTTISSNATLYFNTIHKYTRVDVSSGAVNIVLPDPSLVTAGKAYEFMQIGAAGAATLIGAIIDTGGVAQVSLAIAGAGNIVRLVSDGATTWTVF